jgi:hypothetical protein
VILDAEHAPAADHRLNPCVWFWCAVIVVGHGIVLNEPFVNLEYAFSEAARALAHPHYTEGLVRYWANQANPLGYSAITAVWLRLFDLPAAFWTVRIPALLGGCAILFAGRNFYLALGLHRTGLFFLWAGALTLSPMVWIYTGRATAEVLPTGLVCLALSYCFLARGRMAYHLLAGTLLGVATLVKFNALLMGFGFVYIVFTERCETEQPLRARLCRLGCYTVLPATLLVAYFWWVYASFDVFIIPDRYKERHSPWGSAQEFPTVLGMYLSYLVMMVGFLALRDPLWVWRESPRRQAWTKFLVAAGIAAVACLALPGFDRGEMGYGGFDHLVPRPVFSILRIGCLALGVVLVFEMLGRAWQGRDQFSGVLCSAVFPYLVASSFSRPAQRYLLLCFPLLLFELIVRTPASLQQTTRRLGWASVPLFAALSLVGVVYATAQGRAAENMARWIESHNQIEQTLPGDIRPHAGQHFPVSDNPAALFVVQTQRPQSYLHREPVRVLGREIRSYYLCRRSDVSQSAAVNVGAAPFSPPASELKSIPVPKHPMNSREESQAIQSPQ